MRVTPSNQYWQDPRRLRLIRIYWIVHCETVVVQDQTEPIRLTPPPLFSRCPQCILCALGQEAVERLYHRTTRSDFLILVEKPRASIGGNRSRKFGRLNAHNLASAILSYTAL